ncbi:unnamed protein product [marine sediment metagenome]|uniref:Uncharacterized protein n=1 Tax=marine sediment metagenome TaxID=412755 RepID=X1NJ54_9ZZZZ
MGWRIGRLTSPFDFTSCGRAFSLTEHSLYGPDALASGANRFVVLRVTHEAANNLGSQAAQILLATDIEQGSYRNHFQAVPATARLLPPPVERPTAPGLQTATVVAAEGEPLTTDRDGRIRIQFGLSWLLVGRNIFMTRNKGTSMKYSVLFCHCLTEF